MANIKETPTYLDDSARFPIALVTAAIVAMLFLMIWARYTERLTFVTDQSDLSIQTQIASKSARILHLDEILTMSAMMAASTGDKAWIARYNRFVPELDSLIKETVRLAASKKADKQLSKTDKSNQQLVRMETASFRLVLAGKRQEAWALLTGPEYLHQKKIYSRGIKDFLREIDSEDKIDTSEAAGNSYRQFLEKIVLNCLVLTLWFMALWRISLVWKRKTGNLREKEELLSCTLRSIGDGVITTDCDGRVTRLNPKAETLTGWTKTDAVNRPIKEVFHIINTLTDELAVNPITQVLATGENAEFAYGTIIISKDGLERHIADSCSPVRNNQGRIIGVVLVFRDVTEDYRQRQQLRESEDRFRTLFESSRDAIMILEPPSWKFTLCNQATVSMFGTKDSDGFTALGPWELSPEWQPDGSSSADKSRKAIETAMQEGSYFFEWMHMRVGGEEFPATVLLTRMEQGEKIYLQATVRDITEQKQFEEALRREKDNLAAVFASSPVGMLLLDEETMIVDANSVIASMVSRKPQDIINQRGGGGLGCIHSLENDKGCGFSDVCPDCSLRQGIEQVLSDGTSIRGAEIQTTLLIDGQEQYRWLRISAEPIILNGCKHIVVAIDDITERKQLSEQLESVATQVMELVTKVVTDDSFTGRFVNPELPRCWEVNECTKTDCPAHDNFGNLRCWEVSGTFCRGEVQGMFAQKYGDCSLCKVYRSAMINPIYELGETFNTMAAILSDRREELIQSRAETERLNYELQEALLHSNEYAVSLEVTKGEIEKHAIDLNHQATHDALTGLPNRKYFEQHLSELVIGAEGRKSHSFVVLFLDLDRYKLINDTLGHKAGDLLLIKVAERLQSCLRSEDILARMGGDEFTMILPRIQHRSVAQTVASRMIDSISRPFDIQDNEVIIGASIGIASYPSDGTDAVSLLKHADAAMYKAKQAGRGTFRWYSNEVTILNQ